MLTDPQKNRLQLLLELKKAPEMADILQIEELRKINTLLQTLIDKEIPEIPPYPEMPQMPEIPETDLSEVVKLLKQLVEKEDRPIEAEIKII